MIEGIVILIAVIIFFIIFHKFIKSIFILKHFFSLISLVLGIIIVIIIIFGVSIYKDASDFRKNFNNSTSLFLLEKDDKFLSGIEFNALKKKTMTTMSVDNLANMQSKYDQKKDYRGEYYKVIIMDTNTLSKIDGFYIKNLDINFSSDEAREILLSDDQRKTLKDIFESRNKDYDSSFMNSLNSNELKGQIFSYAITYYFDTKHFKDLVAALKTNEIKIVENSAMFNAFKYVPNFLIDKIASNNFKSINNTTG